MLSKSSFMSAVNCPPLVNAPAKLFIKNTERGCELAFSTTNRQQPTKISSEDICADSGTVSANSMRHSSRLAKEDALIEFAMTETKSKGVEILWAVPWSKEKQFSKCWCCWERRYCYWAIILGVERNWIKSEELRQIYEAKRLPYGLGSNCSLKSQTPFPGKQCCHRCEWPKRGESSGRRTWAHLFFVPIPPAEKIVRSRISAISKESYL